jgi:hypothetical protein
MPRPDSTVPPSPAPSTAARWASGCRAVPISSSASARPSSATICASAIWCFSRPAAACAVSHVGIYIGSNLFAHASTKYGVIISSLDHPYYNRTYVSARRLLSEDLAGYPGSRTSLNFR